MTSLPPVTGRLRHALVHDLAAPLRMMGAVVDAATIGPEDRRERMSTVARDAIDRLTGAAEALAAAIDVDVSPAGVTPAGEVGRLAVAVFARLADAADDLTVEAHDVPLPAATLEAVLVDLFAHALAEHDGGPRAVQVVIADTADEARIEVVDDGRAPTATPAGGVRSVSGSAARSLLVPQRVVEARAGTIAVMPDPGAVRVIMCWPTGAAGSGRG
jgi:hypothetical protein